MNDVALVRRPLSASARTDPGRVRSNNEDLPVCDPERGIYGVIDGVGGHAAGETAAAIARDVILQRLARPLGTPAERVREAIAIANNEIFRRAQAAPELAGMTCVITLALATDGRLTIGHVGDTRLYEIRATGLRKLTHDHSPVGEREDAHEIAELDAMRHPRRHEVFRDVGSALRDKDEPDYVEVVDTVLDDDAAILVCSDGLTDMVASATIDRLVRTHAGDPDAVTQALIAAANDAGGRDNVTVVYAEGPAFAAAMRAAPPAAASPAGAAPVAAVAARRGVLASRSAWFAVGLLIGALAAASLLLWRASRQLPVGPRTIVAAPVASETVGTLAAALATARPGDTIRLEPGTYTELAIVPDGVSLRARVPGAAVFARPSGGAGDWVAITAQGEQGGVISGIRIAATTDAPMRAGIRVQGQARAIELVQVEGPVAMPIELAADAVATLQGSHLAGVGPMVVLGPRARLDAATSVFVDTAAAVPVDAAVGDDPARRSGRDNLLAARSGQPVAGRAARRVSPAVDGPAPGTGSAVRTDGAPNRATAAITLADGAQVTLQRNVFAGFGPDPVPALAPADRELLRTANVVTVAVPRTVR